VPLHALSRVGEELFGSIAAALRHTPHHADAILYGIGDPLVARKACPADSAMYSAVLPTTVSGMVPSFVFCEVSRKMHSLPSSLKTGEGWPFGTIFVRRLTGF
jgi:hypothetical protein